MSNHNAKRLELLDYGRFAACLSVLCFHYLYNGIHNGKISSLHFVEQVPEHVIYGYFSVPFFFMISGYVIFFSAKNHSASQFLVSRAVRLYPAFWAAILFTSCIAYLWGRGTPMAVNAVQILANVTMVPKLLGFAFVDGVYWTLQLEVTFYAFVLLLLLCGLQRHLESVFMGWTVVILIAGIVIGDRFPLISGLYCFFSAGCMLAIVKHDRSWKALAACALSFYLCMRFSIQTIPTFFSHPGIALSGTVIAVLITLFFGFFLFANSEVGARLQLPASRLLGALTYPVYLIHAHFGYLFLSRYATDENKLYMYPLAMAIVLVVACAIHYVVEKRLAGVWYALFGRLAALLFRRVPAVAR